VLCNARKVCWLSPTLLWNKSRQASRGRSQWSQFSAKKLACFSKTNVMITFWVAKNFELRLNFSKSAYSKWFLNGLKFAQCGHPVPTLSNVTNASWQPILPMYALNSPFRGLLFVGMPHMSIRVCEWGFCLWCRLMYIHPHMYMCETEDVHSQLRHAWLSCTTIHQKQWPLSLIFSSKPTYVHMYVCT
jgi:hypothetical protein